MMVGLASLALLGGAMIAVGNVLPDAEGPVTSDASTEVSQSPDAAVTRTPRPTRSPQPLRTMQLVIDPQPPAAATPRLAGGWIRTLEDVTLWSGSSSSASEIGVLEAGEAVYVEEPTVAQGRNRGWLRVQIPRNGWILSRPGGRLVVRHYPYRGGPPAGSIDTLVAGSDGFAGIGWSTPADGSYRPLIVGSSDGKAWHIARATAAESYGSWLAHGPAGWLLISGISDEFNSVPWIWQSRDLRTWRSLGALRDLLNSGGPSQLVGSAEGYVLATWGDGGSGTPSTAIWYSADGLVWSERRMPAVAQDAPLHVASTPRGFYVHSQDAPMTEVRAAAFSSDGWTWSEVQPGDMSLVVGVVAAGDHLVAVDRTTDGRARTWIGTIEGSDLTWAEDPSASSAFANAVVTAVVSDGARPIAIGWERGTDAGLWWTLDGAAWRRDELPAEFDGIPRIAAGGPRGYVLVGNRPTAAGTNSVVWHLTASGRWSPERSPLIEVAPNPSAGDCGKPPADILELMTASNQLLAHCLGRTPITFRARNVPCDECYYRSPGTYEPRWLAQPTENTLFLSPIDGENYEWSAVLHPSVERGDEWDDQWLEVTGHFNDGAAASCHWEPAPADEPWYTGTRAFAKECAARFVVSAVEVVSGP